MKLLIATTKKDLSCNRIIEEAKKKGIEVKKIFYENFKDVKDCDFAILRDPYNTGVDYSEHFRTLARKFGKKVLDYRVYKNYPKYEDKLFQDKLFRDWVPKFYSTGLVFPVIAKERISSRGKGVFVFNSASDLKRFFNKHDRKNYVLEEFLDVDKDLRVLIIGDKVVGSVVRKTRFKDNKGFQGIGVKVAGIYSLSKKIEKKALKAAKKIGADFCGLDILIDKNGKDYLGELNISPQFISTERVLGVNVAEKLIEFIYSH